MRAWTLVIVACTGRSQVEASAGSGAATGMGDGTSQGQGSNDASSGGPGESAGTPTTTTTAAATTTGGDESGEAQSCGQVVLSNGRRFDCLHLLEVAGDQLAVADLDGDSVDDLAVADFGPLWAEEKPMHLVLGGVTPARAGGFGFFSISSDNQLLAGDFDGDGDGDLVIASFGAAQGFWNDGFGGFASSGEVFMNELLWAYSVAEIGAIGQPRIVGVSRDEPPELRVVGFDGDHEPVVFPESAPVAECLIEATVAARLDGDDFPEIVAVPFCDPPLDVTSVRVYRGTPTPQFLLVEPGVPTGSGPGALAAGDFDGDGNTDIAVANEWIDNVMALRGDGEGGLVAQTTTPVCALCTPVALASARLGAPGDSIIVAAFAPDLSTHVLAVILDPLGIPAFEVIRTDVYPLLAVGDFNGDGMDDAAYLRDDRGLELLLATP